MARRSEQRKGSGKKVYSIIVDGKTEVWYFQMMKRHEDLGYPFKVGRFVGQTALPLPYEY
jgi:hypothetical protein